MCLTDFGNRSAEHALVIDRSSDPLIRSPSQAPKGPEIKREARVTCTMHNDQRSYGRIAGGRNGTTQLCRATARHEGAWDEGPERPPAAEDRAMSMPWLAAGCQGWGKVRAPEEGLVRLYFFGIFGYIFLVFLGVCAFAPLKKINLRRVEWVRFRVQGHLSPGDSVNLCICHRFISVSWAMFVRLMQRQHAKQGRQWQ